jgi:hypothetical protein
MHVIKAHEPAVTLFSRDGEVRVFASMSDALRQFGYRWMCNHVAADFRMFSRAARYPVQDPLTGRLRWFTEPVYTESRYIMRGDFGESLTADDFKPLLSRRPGWRSRRDRVWANWNGIGPVPFVRRPRGGHYFRRPGTLNERRLAQVVADEPAPRAKRSFRNLPSDYDDFGVAARDDRNWKRHRRQQWRAPV